MATYAVNSGIMNSQRIRHTDITGDTLKTYGTTLQSTKEECARFESAFVAEAPSEVAVGRCKYDSIRCNVIICSGVPGCGKSTDIAKRFLDKKRWAVVVPSRRLKDDYRDSNCRAYTFHCAFSISRGTIDDLVIDEAFSFYVPYILRLYNMIQPKRMWLYGDPL